MQIVNQILHSGIKQKNVIHTNQSQLQVQHKFTNFSIQA